MESLVALVVLAFGVMGLLGLQLRTMVNNQNCQPHGHCGPAG
jgi:Tfp pilus assembly protein PilV